MSILRYIFRFPFVLPKEKQNKTQSTTNIVRPFPFALARSSLTWFLRSSYTMRTKCAMSDAFVRDCVFAHCASVAQYVYSLSAEHCFRLRNNAISDERVRDCALSTLSVFRPLLVSIPSLKACMGPHTRTVAADSIFG